MGPESGHASPTACPLWLQHRLKAAGGAVSFSTYMEWVLQDPEHGYYGHGHAAFGRRGDFVTAASLGPTLATLLLPQVLQCLDALVTTTEALSLVEWGPGDGGLSRDLGILLAQARPQWRRRLQLVLVEASPALRQRQIRQLRRQPLPWRHAHPAELAAVPVTGVLLANELLDALPVERFTRGEDGWRWQWVHCPQGRLDWCPGPPLPAGIPVLLKAMGIHLTGDEFPVGWSSELALSQRSWCEAAAAALQQGWLWCLDYGHTARRYYSPQRPDGTLMAYARHQAMGNPFLEPGRMDITAHVCTDLLRHWAEEAGWTWCGEVSQGQGLLALDLARHLSRLGEADGPPLAQRLAQREALLRLVDPAGLGGFRWLLFQRGCSMPAPGNLLAFQAPGGEA
ncbi:MAG: SAM-dependent methyltransferase [Synechococcus sp. SB0665_bin_28]|nr:SAM-dependent methyltransferase [Synechococcus sp. SB0665_bin_28]MYF20692.1 SAM-dependent methyltransferase [Synechococcus sp. SB0677_bin_5]